MPEIKLCMDAFFSISSHAFIIEFYKFVCICIDNGINPYSMVFCCKRSYNKCQLWCHFNDNMQWELIVKKLVHVDWNIYYNFREYIGIRESFTLTFVCWAIILPGCRVQNDLKSKINKATIKETHTCYYAVNYNPISILCRKRKRVCQ